MRKSIVGLVLVALSCQFSYGQETSKPDNAKVQTDSVPPINTYGHIPLIQGCDSSEQSEANLQCFQTRIMGHIAKNLDIPQEFNELGMSAEIYAQLIINEDASLNITITKGALQKYLFDEGRVEYAKMVDDEVKKTLATLKILKPAMTADGEPRSVTLVVPVNVRTSRY